MNLISGAKIDSLLASAHSCLISVRASRLAAQLINPRRCTATRGWVYHGELMGWVENTTRKAKLIDLCI